MLISVIILSRQNIFVIYLHYEMQTLVFVCQPFTAIIPLCKHVVAKVTLVPCSVNLTGKRDKVDHGEVTINNARIIHSNLFLTLIHEPRRKKTGPWVSDQV